MFVEALDIESKEPVIVDAQDSGYTVPVNCKEYNIDLIVNVYNFSWEGDHKILPFFGFMNHKLIFFCNDTDVINRVNKVKDYDFMCLSMYAGQLYDFFYSNNFTQYNIGGITYKITWILSKKFKYKFSDTSDEMYVWYDGTKSRFEVMYDILRKEYESEIYKFIDKMRYEMDIYDKALIVKVQDCNNGEKRDPYSGIPNENNPRKPSVLGTNYKINGYISRRLDDPYDSSDKAAIYFTDFLYFQIPVAQKLLIVHEFVHTKLGCVHSHDSCFWHLFEYFTGYSRKSDCSYTKKEMDSDDANFDKGVNIAKHIPPEHPQYQEFHRRYKGKTIKELMEYYKKRYPITKPLKESKEAY